MTGACRRRPAAPSPVELDQTRTELRRDLEGVAIAVRKWIDWRRHVRAHPGRALGLALGLGALVGLRRRPQRTAPTQISETDSPLRQSAQRIAGRGVAVLAEWLIVRGLGRWQDRPFDSRAVETRPHAELIPEGVVP